MLWALQQQDGTRETSRLRPVEQWVFNGKAHSEADIRGSQQWPDPWPPNRKTTYKLNNPQHHFKCIWNPFSQYLSSMFGTMTLRLWKTHQFLYPSHHPTPARPTKNIKKLEITYHKNFQKILSKKQNNKSRRDIGTKTKTPKKMDQKSRHRLGRKPRSQLLSAGGRNLFFSFQKEITDSSILS